MINTELLEVFSRDAQKAVVILREIRAGGHAGGRAGDIKRYTTTVHSMKSALANIGKHDLSEAAAALEKAGLDGDMEFIAAHTDSFITSLEDLVQSITPAEIPSDRNTEIHEDRSFLMEQLGIIKSACEDYDDGAVYACLDLLQEKKWKPQTSELLKTIRETLYLHSDFDAIVKQTDTLMEDEA